jgi:outer membrane protein assembly factor BamB
MVTLPTRPRPGRGTRVLVLALLVLIVGSVAAYLLFFKDPKYPADPALAEALAASTLVEEPAADDGGEWPQWLGPRRDGASTETGLLTAWPADGPKVLWRRRCGDGYSAVAVVGGRLYTMEQAGNDEAVICLDAATGDEVWRHAYPCKFENDQGWGPRSTPTVEGGRVYAVGATGIFHCLDAATGEQKWRHDLLGSPRSNLRWGASFSPLVEGDLVITNPGASGGSVVAFDKEDGRLVWKALDDPAGYSSPIAVTAAGVRQVVVFTGKALVGLAPADGAVCWRYPWETDHGVNAATPLHFRARVGDATDDYLFISSGYGKGCAVIKVRPGLTGSPEVATVYAGEQMCNHFASCVRHKDHLYGFHEGLLACMDLRTGKVAWTQQGFAKGSLLVADGHLIVLGEKGQLALVEATPEGYREKASFDVTRRRCWTVPVLAGGRLYVRHQKEIVCLDLRPSGR